jgi:hypothetical protein
MSKFSQKDELYFSTSELKVLETEMRKYKVPWLYKIVFGSLYKWGGIFMPILFLIILILSGIHSIANIDLFNVIKGFAFFWIFFIGGFAIISWTLHRIKVIKWCKRLKLTVHQWNQLVIKFNLTYI